MAGVNISEFFLQGDPTEIFDKMTVIGEGAFGAVYSAVDLRTKKPIAVKKMKFGTQASEDWEEICKEVYFISTMDHPNIIKSYGAYILGDSVWLSMEYCVGSILDILKLSSGSSLNEDCMSPICESVLRGLGYIHSLGRIHRDIKGGNVLINAKGEIKLCDFGASSLYSNANTFTGSPCWMAPEVIASLESGNAYTQKADIWSFGILCLELAEGRPPHLHLEAMQACTRVIQDPAPRLKDTKKWSPEFQAMVAKCLNKTHPIRRPTIEELLEDPFIKKAEPMVLKKLLRQSRSMSSSRLLQKPKPAPPPALEDTEEKSEKAESEKDIRLDVELSESARPSPMASPVMPHAPFRRATSQELVKEQHEMEKLKKEKEAKEKLQMEKEKERERKEKERKEKEQRDQEQRERIQKEIEAKEKELKEREQKTKELKERELKAQQEMADASKKKAEAQQAMSPTSAVVEAGGTPLKTRKSIKHDKDEKEPKVKKVKENGVHETPEKVTSPDSSAVPPTPATPGTPSGSRRKTSKTKILENNDDVVVILESSSGDLASSSSSDLKKLSKKKSIAHKEKADGHEMDEKKEKKDREAKKDKDDKDDNEKEERKKVKEKKSKDLDSLAPKTPDKLTRDNLMALDTPQRQRSNSVGSQGSMGKSEDGSSEGGMWTLNQNIVGEKAQLEIKESQAHIKALQKLQKEQGKATNQLKKSLDGNVAEAINHNAKEKAALEKQQHKDAEKMKEKHKTELSNQQKKEKKDFSELESDLKKQYKAAKSSLEDKIKKFVSLWEKNNKQIVKDFQGGKQQANALKETQKTAVDLWEKEIMQFFEQHREAVANDQKYEFDKRALQELQEARLKCLQEEHNLRAFQLEELIDKEKSCYAKEKEVVLNLTTQMHKHQEAQLKQSQKVSMDHLIEEQKKEEETTQKELQTEEKNLPRKFKSIRSVSKAEFENFLNVKKKEASEETKKKISSLRGRDQREALERENEAFNKYIKAEKEKIEKTVESEVEKEAANFNQTKQRRLSEVSIRHKDTFELMRAQQEMSSKELAETQKKEAADLENKYKEKLENLQADQAARRKALAASSAEEMSLLKKEFEEELKEIEKKYPRISAAQQAELAKKIEELLSKQI